MTAHETFTRARYRRDLTQGLKCYDFLCEETLRRLEFTPEDEATARLMLEKFGDQTLSFHDVLCAAVMLRYGVMKVFTFDKDFWTLGFEVIPGSTS